MPSRASSSRRVKPTGYSIFPDYDLLMQARVMDILARHTGSPVPRVIGAADEAESPLGQPFFVMERISGLIPADHPPYPLKGWLHDATPAEQAQVFDGGLVAMANLHTVDWRALGLGFLDRAEYGPAGIGQLIAMTGPLFDWVLDGRTMPLLDDARGAVAGERARRPEGGSQLGRLPARQPHVPRLRAGGDPRLGDGDRRAG